VGESAYLGQLDERASSVFAVDFGPLGRDQIQGRLALRSSLLSSIGCHEEKSGEDLPGLSKGVAGVAGLATFPPPRFGQIFFWLGQPASLGSLGHLVS
jgi:hypothetical protein